jgi:hypothetical protein
MMEFFVSLEPPVLAPHASYTRRSRGIGSRIIDASEVEGFTALYTCAATTAVLFEPFVAGPSLGYGYIKLEGSAYNVCLGPVYERSDELNGFPVGQSYSISHRIRKFIPAVWIDCVVAGMSSISYLFCFNG